MIRTVHLAKYVLAEAGMLLRNAAVHISDPGRISRLEPWQSPPHNLETKVIDWGSAIILPGLVNAHSHFELTRMKARLEPPGPFTGWLSRLMAERQSWTKADFFESAQTGARLSLAAGVTLAGDVSASGMSSQALKAEKLHKVVFEEVTGFLPERASQVMGSLEARLAQAEPDGYLTLGVSPHAPYSVSPELFRAVADLAHRRGMHLAIHVAETREEIEFLESGTGDFSDFLAHLGVLPAGWTPPETSPVAYLDHLGLLRQPAVLIHCNHLDEDSMARILNRSCSAVYCPRSHAFFGFENHPVRRLLDMGVNVALGTDSLASCDSLSILDEMRFLFRIRKDLKCDEILRMATLNGAVALGFGGVLGRLRRGYWADMTVLQLPEDLSDRNVMAQILEGAGENLATIVQGEVVWERESGTTPVSAPTGAS
jgi:cytosine/adenosine deaminase-related metal-dependent hydrolase